MSAVHAARVDPSTKALAPLWQQQQHPHPHHQHQLLLLAMQQCLPCLLKVRPMRQLLTSPQNR
jgi:hypothetical protein